MASRLRHKTVSVGVIYDKKLGFLLFHNPKWGEYAFCMKRPKDGEDPGEVALTALEDDSPLKFPEATASPLECIGAFGRSGSVGQDTYYDYQVYYLDPGPLRDGQVTDPKAKFFQYPDLLEEDTVTWSTKEIAKALMEHQEVSLAIVTRCLNSEIQYLVVYKPGYGYFFPTARRKQNEPAEILATKAVEWDASYSGSLRGTWCSETSDFHHSDRYGGSSRKFVYQVCAVEVPDADLNDPGNPFAVGLDTLQAAKQAAGIPLGNRGYWDWFTEEELAQHAQMSLSMKTVLENALKASRLVENPTGSPPSAKVPKKLDGLKSGGLLGAAGVGLFNSANDGTRRNDFLFSMFDPDSLQSRQDEIDCTAFAPPRVRPGAPFLLQVFAHLKQQYQEALGQAQEFDEEAVRRGKLSLTEPVFRGEIICFDLHIEGASCDEPRQELLWRGETDSVAFLVKVDNMNQHGRIAGRVVVNTRNVPIGQIGFTIVVNELAGSVGPSRLASVEHFKSYFASYSSKDRPTVLRCAQLLRLTGRTVRQDVLDLDPGDRWEQRLFELIRECDATLLFWSSNAKSSEWVLKECLYCIKEKGWDRLLPLVIEKPPPLPPPELEELHLNDKLLYFME